MEETRILGESDWDDQDLLTLDEAQFRIEDEIKVLDKELRELSPNSDPDVSRRLTRRLHLLHVLHEQYSAALKSSSE